MMNYLTQHKLISGIVLVVIIGAAWYGFTQSSPAPVLSSSASSSGTGNAQVDAANQNLVNTLLTLQAVQLDGTIFSDQAFLSLQDFTTQVISEPVGRSNPFAPLSRATVVGTSTKPISPGLFAPKK